MKRKLMICAMALCICAGLTGNTGEVSVWASEGSSSDAVRIGALKGPTAMGMAQLLDEDGYDFTIAASPDEIVPMVVQDKLDIAAVPANLAATLYQKTDKDVSVLAVNTLGVLYLVENGDSVKSVEDLKGKTIYASGKGATPEYALNSVLKANGIDPEKDVTVEFKSEHAEVVSALVQDQTAVGLLPQPFVTTALMKNDKLKVALDLNKLWEDSMDDGSKLVTGVVIANNEFVQDHADKVNDFMDAYKESVDFVNSDTEAAAQIIGDHDIIAKEVAQKGQQIESRVLHCVQKAVRRIEARERSVFPVRPAESQFQIADDEVIALEIPLHILKIMHEVICSRCWIIGLLVLVIMNHDVPHHSHGDFLHHRLRSACLCRIFRLCPAAAAEQERRRQQHPPFFHDKTPFASTI